MKNTRNKLLTSLATLIVCFAMLIGSTYAWFTDTASTGVNKIQAGNLDVKLKVYQNSDYVDVIDNVTKIFGTGETANENNAATLWEPGKTQVAYLAIENAGNLNLKYKVKLDVTNEANDDNVKMSDVLKYTITPDAKAVENPVTPWNGTNAQQVTDGEKYVSDETPITPLAVHYFALSIHMDEGADNRYKNKAVEFTISVHAIQDTVEKDSFDDQYDKDQSFPVLVSNNEEAQSAIMTNSNFSTSSTADVNIKVKNDVTLDLNAAGGFYEATLGNKDSENVTIDAGGKKITFDSSYRNAINCYGKLTINDAELDSTYKTEGSTWDDYAIIFRYQENGANEVEFNNVIFDRQVAIEKGVKATFNNCTINQTAATGDMYALWIQAGADVTLNSCTINSINPNTGSFNRAVKIADEYVTNPQLTKLTVNGTTFVSQKKAAVLVTSTAGADIVWGEGNNISQVVADTVNAVWNDADRTAAWGLLTVTGCTKIQES